MFRIFAMIIRKIYLYDIYYDLRKTEFALFVFRTDKWLCKKVTVTQKTI